MIEFFPTLTIVKVGKNLTFIYGKCTSKMFYLIFKIFYTYVGPFPGVLVWSTIHLPSLLLLTVVRQRNISETNPQEEEENPTTHPKVLINIVPPEEEKHTNDQANNDIELEDPDEIRLACPQDQQGYLPKPKEVQTKKMGAEKGAGFKKHYTGHKNSKKGQRHKND